jgi:protein O-mannosyl-transferase
MEREAGWPPHRNKNLLFALGLVAAIFIAYMPAWHGRPVWDDDAHLTRPELRSLGGLAQIWIRPGVTQQYYPLVHSLFWLEHKVWSDRLLPVHLFNILCHAIAALLLWRVLLLLHVPGALFAAAIFALHPLQVESVAWMSELKNTASAAFFFGAVLSYVYFDETRQGRFYALALLLFLLGLFCKTVIAPFPVVLLVIFWWRRGTISIRGDVVPLIPFFVLGIVAGIFTAWVEKHFVGADAVVFNTGVVERGLVAGRAFWFYLGKLFWPADLVFIYPRWEVSRSVGWQYLFPLGALLFVIGLFALRKHHRAPLAAVLIFVSLLFPALGFIDVYPFIYSFVADHFQYLAGSAVITLVAGALVLLADRIAMPQTTRSTVALGILSFCALLTWRQSRVYVDAETLYRATLQKNPACWMAENNLGAILRREGKLTEAVTHLQAAVQINPENAEAQNNLGNALYQEGKADEAVTHYLRAIELRPAYAAPHTNLGDLLLRTGHPERSLAELQKAVEINPGDADAQTNLGNTLLSLGRTSDAVERYRKALDLGIPQAAFEQARAHYNLANALAREGDSGEAVEHYQKSLQLQPGFADAHSNLAGVFFARHAFAQAFAQYETALALNPKSVAFQNNVAWQLATSPDPAVRNGDRAVALATEANHRSGESDPAILNTLAAAYAESGQFKEAVSTAHRALELAESAGNPPLVELLQQAIRVYEVNLPYHPMPE